MRQIMKKLLAAALCTVVSGCCFAAAPFTAAEVSAAYQEDQSTITWDFKNGTLTISGSGEMPDYSTISYYGGGIVTDVPWKDHLSDIEKIIFTGNITYIGSCAFSDCSALKDITLPKSVKGIGSNAFARCVSLGSFIIPDTVESIGSAALIGCNKLISAVLPESLEKIPSDLFSGCQSLRILKIPKGVKAIGSGAFNCCYSLSGISIPENVESIGFGSFFACKSLGEIDLPASVKYIDAQAFQDCSALRQIILKNPFIEYYNGEVFKGVNENAVYYCYRNSTSETICTDNSYNISYLTGKKLDLKVEIPSYSYNGRPYELEPVITGSDKPEKLYAAYTASDSITPASVHRTVADYGSYYRALISLFITPDLDFLLDAETYPLNYFFWAEGYEVFKGSGDIVIDKADPEFRFENDKMTASPGQTISNKLITEDFVPKKSITYSSDDTSAVSVDSSGKVLVHGGSCIITAHLEDKNFITKDTSFRVETPEFSYRLSDGNAVITKYLGSETEITIPSVIDGHTVTGIENSSESSIFSKPDMITRVIIPDTVISVGSYAFSHCKNLADITLPDSLTSIGAHAFEDCESIKSIKLPGSLRLIDSYAFCRCSSLSSINIPDSVTKIGESAFEDCKSLRTARLPVELDQLETCVFYNCTSLSSVKIPQSVTRIGESAFDGCTALKKITISSNVTRLMEFCFHNCTSLTSVSVPEGISIIPEYTFGFYYDAVSHSVKQIEGMTVYGRTGSEAENYARRHSMKFVPSLDPPEPLRNYSVLSENTTYIGKKATVRLSSAGGRGTIKYAVWYKASEDSSYTKARGYSAVKSVSITPEKVGTYTVLVRAKDAKGKVSKKILTLRAYYPIKNTSRLSEAKIYKGSSVTVKASSKGGIGTKKYAVWYRKTTDKKYTKARGYAYGSAVKLTPGSNGTYYVLVKVKDNKNSISQKLLTLKVFEPLKNTSRLAQAKIYKGSSVTVKASSKGGIGTKKYAAWYRKTTDKGYTKVCGYSLKSTIGFTPDKTGKYNIIVKVKDSRGTISQKLLSLTVV